MSVIPLEAEDRVFAQSLMELIIVSGSEAVRLTMV